MEWNLVVDTTLRVKRWSSFDFSMQTSLLSGARSARRVEAFRFPCGSVLVLFAKWKWVSHMERARAYDHSTRCTRDPRPDSFAVMPRARLRRISGYRTTSTRCLHRFIFTCMVGSNFPMSNFHRARRRPTIRKASSTRNDRASRTSYPMNVNGQVRESRHLARHFGTGCASTSMVSLRTFTSLSFVHRPSPIVRFRPDHS